MNKNIVFAALLSALLLWSCSSTKDPLAKYKSGKKEAIVLITTNYGDIKVKLYNETPIHRDNFLSLVQEGFYDDLIFHRVIDKFMIQGGNPATKVTEGDKKEERGTIEAEIKPELYHKKGALAAARMGDNVNPEKRSSASQFYIVQGKVFNDNELKNIAKRSGKEMPEEQKEVYKTIGGTPHLDHNYTVFGEVIEGLWVVDKIAAVKTGQADKPIEDVVMSMQIVKK